MEIADHMQIYWIQYIDMLMVESGSGGQKWVQEVNFNGIVSEDWRNTIKYKE